MEVAIKDAKDPDYDASVENKIQKVTRKSYSLKFKLECLDYFKQNGKAKFWKNYVDRVTMKTFHQWCKDEEKLREFAKERVGVDDFKRNRSSRYRVIFPNLYDWANQRENVSRKELKTYGSTLMVQQKLVPTERTPLGHLSFNDMILAKFLKEYGSDFIRKPSYLPTGNENSKFVCDICQYRLATKETLRRHQLVHSTDRFWKCSLCPVRFKHFHGAISHGRKKHNQDIEPIRISDLADPESKLQKIESNENQVIEGKENHKPEKLIKPLMITAKSDSDDENDEWKPSPTHRSHKMPTPRNQKVPLKHSKKKRTSSTTYSKSRTTRKKKN